MGFVVERAFTRWVAGRMVETRACSYCWATFDTTNSKATCSVECAKRNSAWTSWVNQSRRAGISGSVGDKVRKVTALPPGGASLAASVSRFQTTMFGEEVAA